MMVPPASGLSGRLLCRFFFDLPSAFALASASSAADSSASCHRSSRAPRAKCVIVCSSISSTEGMMNLTEHLVHRALRPAAASGTNRGLAHCGQSMVICDMLLLRLR